MCHSRSSSYAPRVHGTTGRGAYWWCLPKEEPCFLYATQMCFEDWRSHAPSIDDLPSLMPNHWERCVVECLIDAGFRELGCPYEWIVEKGRFSWDAISWGIIDRKIGALCMSSIGTIFWSMLTLKRDRMVFGIRRALKRMQKKGWIRRYEAEIARSKYGKFALYAPTEALVNLLRK